MSKSTAASGGIMVTTTTGSTYQVANGTDFDYQVGPTTELAVVVKGPLTADDSEAVWLAAFGSVEVVYLAGQVADVTPAAPPAPAAGRSLL